MGADCISTVRPLVFVSETAYLPLLEDVGCILGCCLVTGIFLVLWVCPSVA